MLLFSTANVSVLAIPLVPSLALEPMTLYGTHVKEILTVFAESVPERHVDRFEVVGQLLLGPADLRAKVAPRHVHQDHIGMLPFIPTIIKLSNPISTYILVIPI